MPVSGEGGVPGRVVLAEPRPLPRPLPRPRPQDAPDHLSAGCQGRNHNKVDETLKQYVNNGTNITERRMTLNGHWSKHQISIQCPDSHTDMIVNTQQKQNCIKSSKFKLEKWTRKKPLNEQLVALASVTSISGYFLWPPKFYKQQLQQGRWLNHDRKFRCCICIYHSVPPPTDLRLRHHGVVSIAQRRKLQPLLPLRVALLEELLHAARGPLQTLIILTSIIFFLVSCRKY